MVLRCGLKTLPSYLTDFKYLKYLDARDNNITEVPNEVTNWIKMQELRHIFQGINCCVKMMQKSMVNIVKKYVVNIVGRRMVIRIIIVIQVVILKSVIMMEENVSCKINEKR